MPLRPATAEQKPERLRRSPAPAAGRISGSASSSADASASAGRQHSGQDSPQARAFGAAAPGETDRTERRPPTLVPETAAPTFRPQPEERLFNPASTVPPPPPPVRIEIGRLELTPLPAAAPVARPTYMSLSDYLRLRVRP
ncbi:hypothetical protein [Ferrovibrio xuzhouensis]|uniref:Uncharacterized protein n=1 Tax=Ferrovibrio xuzhouensis TaxID=1576914 RepID=A0ABV7VIT8_9PROT